MSTLSGLSDSVRVYVGRAVALRLEYGWGWTLHTRGSPEAEPFRDIDAINLTSVQVIPSEFFADGGASTRGFLGRVVQPGHLLHDLPVLAFTMSDGLDYDFMSHICPAWRFFFGEGELVCPHDSFPRLRGARIIGGYMRCSRSSLVELPHGCSLHHAQRLWLGFLQSRLALRSLTPSLVGDRVAIDFVTMAHTLPTRLRYLEPVRKQLAALDPDEIHENMDLSILRRAVRKRLKGLSDDESRALLREDADELARWLSTQDLQDQRLYFVLPILPDAIEALLTEQPQLPPERGEASMELPEGAKLIVENGCWSVKWRRFLLTLYPSHREEVHSEAGRFKDYAKSQPIIDGSGMSVVEVRFGDISGIKCTSKMVSAKFKRVDYAFDVPGGHLTATLDSSSRDFDESEFERYFHTMRVLNYPPPEARNT